MTGNCWDNSYMTNDLKNGMAFAISNWSTFDTWLWGDRCQAGECNATGLTFNNLVVKTGGDSPTPPHPPTPPTPGNYNYGGECGTPYDDDCNGCNCHWSWPTNESWDGADAKCRCM
jgi:hypothetical protein